MFEDSMKSCSNKQFADLPRVSLLNIIRIFNRDKFFTKRSSLRARVCVRRKKFVSGLNKEDRVSRSCGKPVAPAAEVRDDP